MSLLNFTCLINVSDDSVFDFAWVVDLPTDPSGNNLTAVGYSIAVIVTLFFLIGVPWNLFVICTIVRKKLYSNPTIMSLLNLAITNLLFGLLVMPFNIITGFSGEYLFGSTDKVRCHVCQTGILLVVLPWVSIYTTTLMSIDRFIYLKRPMKYSTLITPKRMLIVIVIIWILCIIVSLPPLFGFGEVKFSYQVSTCAPFVVGMTHVAPNYFYIVFLTAILLIPLICLFVMYISVVVIIRKSILAKYQRSVAINQDAQGAENLTSIANQKKAAQLRLARLFAAIFTANLITWLPITVLALTGAIGGTEHIPNFMYTSAYLSFLSETVIHPVLESALIREVRMIISGYLKYWKEKMKCCQCKRETIACTSSLSASGNEVDLTNLSSKTIRVNVNSLLDHPDKPPSPESA